MQLFNILIDNATKFVGEEGRIIIDAKSKCEHVIMKVSDNGTGIEKSVLPYIFDEIGAALDGIFSNGLCSLLMI